jgi:GntR family transcriptional regulator/MocR family aminotransferase
LRKRRDTLLAGLAREAPGWDVEPSVAGMHLVAWLPGWSLRRFDAFLDRCAGRGLGLHPIHPHFVRPPRWPGLLLGFAGLSVPQLRAATALLGECLREER